MYGERETYKYIYILRDINMYTFRRYPLKKNVSEETVGSSEDDVEGLVKRVKLRLENQYFIYKENHGLIICMYKHICMYIFRSKYIFTSLPGRQQTQPGR